VIRSDKIAQGDVLKYDLARRHNDGDTDIPRLRQGRVGGQIWAAYVPTDIEHPARSVLEQIVLRINAAHPEAAGEDRVYHGSRGRCRAGE
jgi:membrane dipeptidase